MDKENLEREPSKAEIKNVVFSFDPFKSPRLDGLHPFFYQKYWDIVVPSVNNFCIKTFREAKVDKSINRTNIYLIPK